MFWRERTTLDLKSTIFLENSPTTFDDGNHSPVWKPYCFSASMSLHFPIFLFLLQFLTIPHYCRTIFYLLYLLSSFLTVLTTINYSFFSSIATFLGFISILNSTPTFPVAWQIPQSCLCNIILLGLNSPSSYKTSSPSSELGSRNHWVVLPHSHIPSMPVPFKYFQSLESIPFPWLYHFLLKKFQRVPSALKKKNYVYKKGQAIRHLLSLFSAPSLSK